MIDATRSKNPLFSAKTSVDVFKSNSCGYYSFPSAALFDISAIAASQAEVCPLVHPST
jgi:hypothetical protein